LEGGGALDYKLPGARAQSAGLIILALTSQGQFCDTEGQSAEITDTWKVPVRSSGQRVVCVCGLFRLAVTNDLESLIGCLVNSKVHDVVLM